MELPKRYITIFVGTCRQFCQNVSNKKEWAKKALAVELFIAYTRNSLKHLKPNRFLSLNYSFVLPTMFKTRKVHAMVIARFDFYKTKTGISKVISLIECLSE